MPGCRCVAICSTADTMYDMSGSFVLRSGVGTQMLIVSSSATHEKSVVARSWPSATSRATSSVATSGMYERALADRLDLAPVEVDAGRVEAGAGKLHRERQADVAEPDDADARGARRQLPAERAVLPRVRPARSLRLAHSESSNTVSGVPSSVFLNRRQKPERRLV